jgi:hypothetical protein
MTLTEAELMRAICAGLDCPLPPLVTAHPLAPTDLETAGVGRERDVLNEYPGT